MIIKINDSDNPYGSLIVQMLEQEFPLAISSDENMLEAVFSALIGTGQTRLGPAPSPEKAVAIREILRKYIYENLPIPILIPWGSKKPTNDSTVDLAEVGGIKTLICLANRIKQYYKPGVDIVARIEDLSGYYLFTNPNNVIDTLEAKRFSDIYSVDLKNLYTILGKDHNISGVLESELGVSIEEYNERAESVRPLIAKYLNNSSTVDERSWEQLLSYKMLASQGWRGTIPSIQREYYFDRYRKNYPNLRKEDYIDMMSRYFASSKARYSCKMLGNKPSWKFGYVQLNFVPPVPGMPNDLADGRVFYRTVPTSIAKTHIPAWRAKGYVAVNGNAKLKIASWWDKNDYIESNVTISNGSVTVTIRADYLIV
jgi:hypothetical protein